MKNKTSFVTIVLTILILGFIVYHEYTNRQYIKKLVEIKIVKDSLDLEVKNIEQQLKVRDSLLVKSIIQSKEIISEIEKRMTISEKAYNTYKANSQNIIDELVKLSNK
jgi:hypothetical protein